MGLAQWFTTSCSSGGCGQFEHAVELVGIHHQLEVQAEPGQPGEILPPGRIGGEVAALGTFPGCVG